MAFNNNSGYNRQQPAPKPVPITEKKNLDKKTYVELAEKVVCGLPSNNGYIEPKKNQIRNILSMMNELYDMVRTDTNKKLSDDVQSHIQYVKMKMIYAAGRENTVKIFLEKSSLISYINGIGDSREELILVCHYMEALVAYHRYHTKEN